MVDNDLRTHWNRRGGVCLPRDYWEDHDAAEMSSLAEQFIVNNVKYSVDDFSCNLREIERQVGMLAYLPKKSVATGSDKTATSSISRKKNMRQSRRLSKQSRISNQVSGVKPQSLDEKLQHIRISNSDEEFYQFLDDIQKDCRDWLEDELLVRRQAEIESCNLPDFNLASNADKAKTSQRALPTLVASSCSRHNHKESSDDDKDEIILFTHRDVEPKKIRQRTYHY